MKIGNLVLYTFSISVLLFLLIPIVIVIPMSFSSATSLQFPPPGFSLQWYKTLFGNAGWISAMKTSLMVALPASLIGLVLGILASYGLSKGNYRGKNLILAQLIAPMVVPTIITAVALYIYFAKIKMLGTMTGLILAHTIIVVPYTVLILLPVFESFDSRLELAARSLGASWFTAFRKVIFPNVFPSIAGTWFFVFMLSFDELVVTLFLSGVHATVPKKMFSELIMQINPTITAVSTLLVALTALIISIVAALLRKRANGLGSFLS